MLSEYSNSTICGYLSIWKLLCTKLVSKITTTEEQNSFLSLRLLIGLFIKFILLCIAQSVLPRFIKPYMGKSYDLMLRKISTRNQLKHFEDVPPLKEKTPLSTRERLFKNKEHTPAMFQALIFSSIFSNSILFLYLLYSSILWIFLITPYTQAPLFCQLQFQAFFIE